MATTQLSPHRLLCLLFVVTTTPLTSSITLEETRDFLRAGDKRLVRRAPSDNTIANQYTEACDIGLRDAFIAITQPNTPLEHKTIAADVVTLCTGNNTRNKAKMLEFGVILHEALIAMVLAARPQNGQTWMAAGAALEAISSSTVNSPENHNLFMKRNVLGAVAHVILAPCMDEDPCNFAQMQAASVIDALAASHCFTETGDCLWEFDHGLRQVMLDQDQTIKLDTEPVRQLILSERELVTKLIEMTCSGPVNEVPDEEYPWPNRANIAEGSENFSTIRPWAAAGALRNIALSPMAHRAISPAFKCLCDMAKSPDALEEERGEEAIDRLGYAEGDCPRLYAEECQNLNNWIDIHDEDCDSYERNRWCVEYGEVEDARGANAYSACCACGGGSTGPNRDS